MVTFAELKEAEMRYEAIDFIRESNRIEGIKREPTKHEIQEYNRFMDLYEVTVADLEKFVKVYAPHAVLRRLPNQNVKVGSYYPPEGGPHIEKNLDNLLVLAKIHRNPEIAYTTHIAYEKLHPFTDGNGRSGRMLWMWMMQQAPLGFLHHFYYQTLKAAS